MNELRLRQVQELFDRAAARPADERSQLLADACGSDAELRTDVESLLAHLDSAGETFLRPPDSGTEALETALQSAAAQPDPLLGQRIGRFHVERLIAFGGMGAVYEAIQDQPRRIVALKVLHPGVLSPSAMRRFQDEAQILGRLRHPNIAQVHEAGVAEIPLTTHHSPLTRNLPVVQVPYFAMEYIPNARPITDYASANGLTVRQRLELFLQVCDAVHHGHQKGVIHRDLKPDNILVADEKFSRDSQRSASDWLPGVNGAHEPGRESSRTACQQGDGAPSPVESRLNFQVKVIDFGVARCTDVDIAATMHTHTGQLVGTLAYMSPEQCRADPQDIDTRSDVYSLGVVLYELLCERLPYEVSRTNVVDAARAICERPPQRPSAVVRRMRGDLETIVLKPLEKDRGKRYPSADALAQDIRRYLAGEPIQARSPTMWTNAVRWSLRNPKKTTAVMTLGISSCIFVGTWLATMWLANRHPYRLDWADDCSVARLVSYIGRHLHSWATGHVGNSPPARWRELIVQPNKFGGRRLAILGFGYYSSGPGAGSLCAFDVDRDWAKPVWMGAVTSGDLPSNLDHDKYYGRPQVGDWAMFDVFADSPGEEIVASHIIGDWSPRCIRIYDAAGRVLYQVWHDGGADNFCWMSEPRLLVCTGNNAEVEWVRRGHPDVVNHPRVLFALRPQLNFVSQEFVSTTELGKDDPLSPAWYKCLLPPKKGSDEATWDKLEAPRNAREAGRRATLSLQVRHDSGEWGGVQFQIDEHGEEIPSTRYADSNYQRLPFPTDYYQLFKLGKLPPKLPDETKAGP